ncbi:hypothetical protein F7725_029224 [Dissostichus mawsoni]|uniref:WD repeat domain 60 n=1 Tax=Dissostichus mawsoni TaxID=36200 RepID=A0A7J5XHU0_DISMA|nr:hypothetical protein F7725_029224 [Dissostichus mawsoni]
MSSDKEGGHVDNNVRRRDDSERRQRGGESVGRRDPEKETRREKDKLRERRDKEEVDKYADRRKEGSRDRRSDKERDRREETRRDKVGQKEGRQRQGKTKRGTRGEERERRRDEDMRKVREGETERREKQDREKRDRHRERDKDEDKRNDRERRERKHVEVKEDGENREEQRRRREERERRHKERGNHDEKRKHDSRAREHRDVKEVVEEVRGHGGDRERTERDKNKERKHREDEEPERNHRRDPTSSRKSDKATDKSHDSKTEDKAAVRDLRATAEPDYEEDFEELDESPDEEEEEEKESSEVLEEKEELTAERRKEIEAIQRAMDEENQRKTPSVDSQRGKFIDFVAAKQREVSKKVASKQKKRSTELLRLIDLDFSTTASLLDLPPAYVQCNEDNVDRDIQTEETEVCEKWTQHPPEHNGACGDPNLSREAQDKSEMSFDSRRLTAFLRSASQVMVVLLEEHRADRKSLEKMKSPTDSTSFSDGSLLLNTKLPFLYGRSVSLLHFSPAQKHTVMSVHRPTETPSAVRLDSCSVICIWNIWEPSSPQRVLIYESEVQCCCFSPGKAVLVFAGTSVGSVLLWDLRENTEDHYKVVPSSSSSDVPLLASEEESSGLSFQLASLDEVGVLNFWVVLELPKANEAGSPTDLGLRPGGKVKLLHSSVLLTAERVSQRDAAKTGPLQTLHLKFLPTDSNHLFIGTNMEAGVQPVDVTSIHFSPFRKHLFLVGCGDGSIRLHAVSQQHPVSEWRNSTSGEPVISLQWNQTRPSVFCVLDGASNIHIWDLLRNDSQPVSGKIEMQYFTRSLTVSSSEEEEKLESLVTEAF